MSWFDNFWGEANDVCHDLSEPVGFLTGMMYTDITGSEAVGAGVGGFVTENWGNVCDLPTNLANELGYGDSSNSSE